MKAQSQPTFLQLLNPIAQIRTIYRHRDLLWQFTIRNVELRHRGSLIGLGWAVLHPLLTLALYVFIFSYVFGGTFNMPDESRWDYSLGILLGLSIFHLVAESLGTAPGVITNNPNFVKKVVFPLEILPAATVGAAVVHMLITLGLIAVGVLLGGHGLSWSALWLPVILLPVIGLALGIAWMVAALGVFFRDVSQLMLTATTALMFGSAIFYPASQIQEKVPSAWSILQFNPIIHAVEAAREVLLWRIPLGLSHVIFLYVSGFLAAWIGFAFFARLKRAFADVI